MTKPKYDGVIQAVHYRSDGQVDWVRAYLRRGPTFSDLILLDRETLLDHLKTGKRYWAGKRIHQLAGTFEVTQPIRIITKDGQDILVTGEGNTEKDLLAGVPVI